MTAEPPAISRFGSWLEQQIRQQERWPVLVAGSVVAGGRGSRAGGLRHRAAPMATHALLVLAPRKPDRNSTPPPQIAAAGGWKVIRRSRSGPRRATLDENADVLLLDSIGELAGLYSLADAVFVGGSLVPSGGHNILEPAWFAKSAGLRRLHGKFPRDGRTISRRARRRFKSPAVSSSAKSGCSSSRTMRCASAWARPRAKFPSAIEAPRNARSIASPQSGTLPSGTAHERSKQSLLWPFTLLYGAAAHLRARAYRRGIFRPQRLDGIVISVGNLTTGGTGKTPMVLWIAERLLHEGKKVGILTRGYRGERLAPSAGE